eukprot:6575546-Pyramimonas_sp.AAC.1
MHTSAHHTARECPADAQAGGHERCDANVEDPAAVSPSRPPGQTPPWTGCANTWPLEPAAGPPIKIGPRMGIQVHCGGAPRP